MTTRDNLTRPHHHQCFHDMYHEGFEAESQEAASCSSKYGFELYEYARDRGVVIARGKQSQMFIRCYPLKIPGMPKATYPNTFCEAENLVIDFSRLTPANELLFRPGYSTGEDRTLFTYEKGALSGNCSADVDLELFQADHMKDLFSSLRCSSSAPAPDVVEEGVTLLVTREMGEHKNMFHATTDFLNAFAMLEFFEEDPESVQVLLMDKHSPSNLDEMWNTVFSRKKPTRQSTLFGQQRVLFKRIIFSPPGYSNFMFSNLNRFALPCVGKSNLVAGFSRHVLQRFNITQDLERDELNVILIVRKPYLPEHPKISRQFSNEVEILEAIRAAASTVGVKISLHVVDFAELKSVKTQITVVAQADLLIGMHGAGLTHSLWLPEHGGLVELRPSPADGWYCFSHIAVLRGLEYATWDNPQRSAVRITDETGDKTEVDVQALADMLQIVLLSIISRRSKST
eukprot:TRINITY_DN8176_c0_g1_i2.p1 TRINITY_DN8176_c0_g1~~TRINITY_DN8176_c0_g1_i2.p1  ORF type:complete len:457 (-),score=124.48 TRINITY_DN8176_c0_g1_i2:105-1475(-)